ncbi:C40 family peptidase [Aureimonas populi]|uniref:NlpC/P60 family protein n=1 Tax=Aureimonas populi TaxID=1701758 RepID=A0ABW5CME5_9HYPH|nr:C40 family peptidase [Aureimonas populi]
MTVPLDPRLNAFRPDLADRRLDGRVRAARFVGGAARRVTAPLAALRRRPASDAPLETQALAGEAVLVFDEPGEGWAWVQLESDSYVGWMESEALGPPAGAPSHEVSVPRTLVFPGPDIKLPPVSDLPMGARIAARGVAEDRNARYVLIEPFGAVVEQHLRPVGAAAAEDFVSVAERFLGAPYLWGGKSVLGMDCSGLVQLSLAMTGRAAPRDTDMQEAFFAPVGEKEPRRRGDLIFWKGHVGLMLDGERLLHANAHHMMTAVEPLAEAVARLAARGAPVTSVRRA